MAELHDVNDASFEESVVRSALPVLVDFWGESCPACRAISPILLELAAEYAGRVRILKLHTGENAQAMARYRVMSLPTVLAFAKGRVVGQITGARPKAAFRELVERALASEPPGGYVRWVSPRTRNGEGLECVRSR